MKSSTSSTIHAKVLSSLLFVFIASGFAHANTGSAKTMLSLENLERERAALIQELLSPANDMQTKTRNINRRQSQLSDMERMVMRDERLINSGSPMVKKAFDNYESTFLVHAGAENDRTAAQQWLSQVNISNAEILKTQIGFRK